MTTATDRPDAPDSAAASARLGAWVGLVHALLLISWTAYVLFLPSFLAKVGLPASWLIWIVLIDQALFVVFDWASSLFADRMGGAWRKLGAAIAIAAFLSALLFAALPWVAGLGNSTGLMAFTVGWAIVSSFLRAPVLTLIGRIGGAHRQGRAVAITLCATGLATAAGPLLTVWLRQHDPHAPFALASLALALAGLVVLRADAWLVPPARKAAAALDAPRWSPVLWTAGVLLVAGIGFQWHTVLLSASAMPWTKPLWGPWFWGGFTLGLLGSMQLVGSALRLKGAAIALLVGAVAATAARQAGGPVIFALAQGVAGAAWAVAMHTGLGVALSRSAGQRLATPVGLVFSALALAALCRVLVVALQGQAWAGWTAVPAVAWALAALGFWWHPWRVPAEARP